MKARFARSIVSTVSLSLCSVASAQYTLPSNPYNGPNVYATPQQSVAQQPGVDTQRFYVAPNAGQTVAGQSASGPNSAGGQRQAQAAASQPISRNSHQRVVPGPQSAQPPSFNAAAYQRNVRSSTANGGNAPQQNRPYGGPNQTGTNQTGTNQAGTNGQGNPNAPSLPATPEVPNIAGFRFNGPLFGHPSPMLRPFAGSQNSQAESMPQSGPAANGQTVARPVGYRGQSSANIGRPAVTPVNYGTGNPAYPNHNSGFQGNAPQYGQRPANAPNAAPQFQAPNSSRPQPQSYANQAYQSQAYQNQAYQNQARQNQAYQNPNPNRARVPYAPQPGQQPQGPQTFSGYQAPAKWSNYNTTPGRPSSGPVTRPPSFGPNQSFTPVATRANELENLLPPSPDGSQSIVQGQPINQAPVQSVPSVPYTEHAHGGGTYGGNAYGGDAYGGGSFPMEGGFIEDGGFCDVGCAPARPQLSPWFGGVNFLFLQVENDYVRNLVVDDADGRVRLSTRDIEPQNTFGFEVSFGRYLCCGKYGIGATYFHLDPDEESRDIFAPVPGNFRVAMPQLRDLEIDPYGVGPGGPPPSYGDTTSGVNTVYDYADIGAQYRAIRDVDIQGIEINFSCFGLSGAQRAAGYSACGLKSKLNSMFGGGCGSGCGGGCGGSCGGGCGDGGCGDGGCGTSCGPSFGFGGLGGPLIRPCNGRLQFVSSHGVRWFRFRDNYELQSDINGVRDYQRDDLFFNVDVDNNLVGYQFGSRLNYCLNCRWSVGFGGKFGLYGNEVRFRHRVGTRDQAANIVGRPDDRIDFDERDTFLSTLGELDLNVGCRLSDCLTIRGGYRLLGVTSIATSISSYPVEYSSVEESRRVWADDSLVLHGGYFGVDYNW